ncbi:MAG: hypothetical protein ACPIOQ_46705, partial [Promethearchaeia archaeon]
FWYMGLYQLLEENGRKTGNVSSAVIPIMGAQDLLNAGPDACVFLPEMAHPNGCEEWVRALELSQVSTAVVAGFVLAPEVTNKHAQLHAAVGRDALIWWFPVGGFHEPDLHVFGFGDGRAKCAAPALRTCRTHPRAS